MHRVDEAHGEGAVVRLPRGGRAGGRPHAAGRRRARVVQLDVAEPELRQARREADRGRGCRGSGFIGTAGTVAFAFASSPSTAVRIKPSACPRSIPVKQFFIKNVLLNKVYWKPGGGCVQDSSVCFLDFVKVIYTYAPWGARAGSQTKSNRIDRHWGGIGRLVTRTVAVGRGGVEGLEEGVK